MSTYYLLTDHAIGPYVFSAGSTQSTVDAGGLLPFGWICSNNVDPLDTAAVTQFYANGPCQPSLFRAQFSTQPVRPPKTFWVATPLPGSPAQSYQLTGLGSGMPAVNM
jgi:hypothetical protein